jgi:hypothetical protein
MDQATCEKDKYKPVTHQKISVGDIVLMKEQYTKPTNYPMGLVKSVQINSLGEITGAEILKGTTREIVKRHSSAIIPLLRVSVDSDTQMVNNSSVAPQPDTSQTEATRPVRKAAVLSRERTGRIFNC